LRANVNKKDVEKVLEVCEVCEVFEVFEVWEVWFKRFKKFNEFKRLGNLVYRCWCFHQSSKKEDTLLEQIPLLYSLFLIPY
jgi:hypothetical protein